MDRFIPFNIVLRLCLTFIAISVASLSKAQTPHIFWNHSYGGYGEESPVAICKTSDSGFVIAASTNSIVAPVTGNHGGYDFWLFKINSSGERLWQKCFGGSQGESLKGMWPTADGGFVLSGNTMSTDGDVSGNDGKLRSWTIKTDSIGNILHQDTGLAIRSMKPMRNGHFAVAGTCKRDNFWIAELDTDLHIVWQQCYGGTGYEEALDIQQAQDGGFIAVGYTNSSDGNITDFKGLRIQVCWVVKTDNKGVIQWQKTIVDGIPYCVQQLADSSYAIAGNTTMVSQAIGQHGTSADFWLMKLGPNGDSSWQRAYGSVGTELAYSFLPTIDGGFILVGQTEGGVWGDINSYSYGKSDVWIMRTDKLGNLEWERRLGGTFYDAAMAMVAASDSELLVAAYSQSSDHDVSENNGGTDVWLLKIGYHVDPVVVKQGPAFQVFPNPVATDLHIILEAANNNLVVIRDIAGHIVQEVRLSGKSTEINLERLAAGTYCLSIEGENSRVIFTKL